MGRAPCRCLVAGRDVRCFAHDVAGDVCRAACEISRDRGERFPSRNLTSLAPMRDIARDPRRTPALGDVGHYRIPWHTGRHQSAR